jgi:hypothetical protein
MPGLNVKSYLSSSSMIFITLAPGRSMIFGMTMTSLSASLSSKILHRCLADSSFSTFRKKSKICLCQSSSGESSRTRKSEGRFFTKSASLKIVEFQVSKTSFCIFGGLNEAADTFKSSSIRILKHKTQNLIDL